MYSSSKKIVIYLILTFFMGLNFNFSSNLKLTNYQKYLNRRFQKVRRTSTDFIIIHTSEAGKKSTLHTLSDGKRISKYHRTPGGHANYAIDRAGIIYKILDPVYRADHAGKSMWNNMVKISDHSIGIELVGFHYGTITEHQYSALADLLVILQARFKVEDKNVLTHSQISYGDRNYWFNKKHRGRKKCALNFIRKKAGLIGMWDHDPDVRAKRLLQDPIITKSFYSKKAIAMNKISPRLIPVDTSTISNIINKDRTAWSIAGEEYNKSTTLYIFPDKSKSRGDQIKYKIGWGDIPSGTEVLLNQSTEILNITGPIYTLSKNNTAWSFAGRKYNSKHTFYLYPDNQLLNGIKIPDWDDLPNNTKIIVDYTGPYEIKARVGKTPWGIAKKNASSPLTIYFIPEKGFITGDQIKDFSNIPKGSKIFLKR